MRHETIAAGLAPAGEARAGPIARRFVPLVVAVWLFAAGLRLAIGWHSIVVRHFPDADDQLRLIEVRAWLDGQAFRDVTQYRMNPPHGASMHWSRLVDLPIAAIIAPLRPLIGYERAEIVAAVAVPLLLLLLALLLAVALVTRRLAGPAAGLVAAATTVMTFGAIVQFMPLRVDHHNWQILLSTVAAGALLMRSGTKGGAIAGAALAVALQISLEALPFAVLWGAVAAAIWAMVPSPGAAARMRAFAIALFAVEAALTLGMRGDLAGYCDAASGPHLVALGIAAAGLALLARVAPGGVAVRLAALGGVAAAAAAAFHAIPPHCGLDAFPMLEPIVRRYWYMNVAEGLPVWRQSGLMIAASFGFPIVGLACAALAIRAARGADRARWAGFAALLLGAVLIAVSVERAAGLASVLAVPPAAWATVRGVAWMQARRGAAMRVLGTVLAATVLSPMAPGVVAAMVPALQDDEAATRLADADNDCGNALALRRLDALPAGLMLAPLNVGPTILLQTRHSILTGGYHRNHAAIADELRVFLGGDARAHAILRRRGIRYVEFCADRSETGFYRRIAPSGFAQHLATGRAPAWLRPVLAERGGIRVWEVAG